MVIASHRQIVRACKARGWTIQPTALEGIEGYVHNNHDNKNHTADAVAVLQGVLDSLSSEMSWQNKITVMAELWQVTLEDQDEEVDISAAVAKRNNNNRTKPTNIKKKITDFDDLQVVSAFETSRLV
jgi:hypothetical protein